MDLEKDLPAAPEPPREDVEALCSHLAERVEKNGAKRPNTNKGARDAARLLLDADNRPLEQAHRLIDWCAEHHFWHKHVLSMPKFREKYDQLLLDAKASTNARGQPGRYQAYQNPADQSVYDQPLEAS